MRPCVDGRGKAARGARAVRGGVGQFRFPRWGVGQFIISFQLGRSGKFRAAIYSFQERTSNPPVAAPDEPTANAPTSPHHQSRQGITGLVSKSPPLALAPLCTLVYHHPHRTVRSHPAGCGRCRCGRTATEGCRFRGSGSDAEVARLGDAGAGVRPPRRLWTGPRFWACGAG